MKVYGQLEKAQAENVTSDTASEPKGMMKYRTDSNVMKVSNGTTYKEMVDTDTAQTLTNKTLSTGTVFPDDGVTNAKLANMATQTIKGRTTAGTGDPEDLTATQATAILNTFTDTLKGLVPPSGGGTTNFLRADGTFAAPSSGSTQTYRSISSTDSVVATDDGIQLSGAAFTLTFPTSSTVTGQIFTVVHQGSNFVTYTLVGTGGESFVGAGFTLTDWLMNTTGESITVQSTGSGWLVIDRATDTNWVGYAATLTGFGTVTGSSFTWRRRGRTMEINGYWTNGTVAASTASISLPGGLSISTSQITRANTTANPGQILGTYAFTAANSCGFIVSATGTSTSLVYFGNSYDTATPLTSQLGNAISASSNDAACTFSIPVQQWYP